MKRDLQGDAVTIGLEDGRSDDAARIVSALAGVLETGGDGRLLRARVHDGGTAVPEILSRLESNGIRVASVSMARPSLDDVYLHYAGRDFRTEDEAAG